MTNDSTMTTTTLSLSSLQEPILVGYAFGPKKMATMGVVMAEASRTKFSACLFHQDDHNYPSQEGQEPTMALGHKTDATLPPTPQEEEEPPSRPFRELSTTKQSLQPKHPRRQDTLTRAALEEQQQQCHEPLHLYSDDDEEEEDDYHHSPHPVGARHGRHCRRRRRRRPSQQDRRILFTSRDLRSVVRVFRSSCSSVSESDQEEEEEEEEEENTITSTTASTMTTKRGDSSSIRQTTTSQHPYHPVRVSFVPLDLNEAIEEQHGGNFDIILHKMTEDILSLSELSTTTTTHQATSAATTTTAGTEPAHHHLAMERIERLNRYAATHPQCSLVDHPARVQVVMNRLHISQLLSDCLVGVKSASGRNVETPPFVALPHNNHNDATDDLGLRFPLVAKPLTAAGTKKSHCMAIVLNEQGLRSRSSSSSSPCLLQEYVNHNGILFKVYVLGDRTDVFCRSSLPNLPTDQATLEALPLSSVDFDSQRPYPKATAFGLEEDEEEEEDAPLLHNNNNNHKTKSVAISSEEIAPVVSALKKAFGLDMFGFDILVAASTNHNHKNEDEEDERGNSLLVVDVNYFPSYKEVDNFPMQLAKYLTQRALDTRNQEFSQSRGKGAPAIA